MSFSPIADTVSAAVTTSSAALALATIPDGGGVVRIYNDEAQAAFVKFGTSTVTVTTTTGTPIASKAALEFEVGPTITHVAHITTGTPSAKIYATTGKSTR